MACSAVPSSSSSASVQNGTNSVEFLLKQVYAVHRNKIKELEHQLKVVKNTKQIESIATCNACEELKTSLEQVKKEYDRQLDEKDKLIEDLQSRLEIAFEMNEADELTLESEKPLKRKRGLRWSSVNGDAVESESSQINAVESPMHSDPFISQRDVVILVPETVVDTQSDVKYISQNDCDKSDMIVPETLVADTECTNSLNNGNCSKPNDGGLKKQFYFDTPQKGYRRPKYKQTTLTQNVFAAPIVSLKDVKNEENDEAFLRVDLNVTQLERGQSLTPVEQRQLQDSTLDETFVPSPYFRRDNSVRASTPGDATPSPDLIFPVENIVMSPAHCDSDSTCSEDLLKQLGMKSPVRTNNEAKDRPLETQDSFNKVPSKICKSPKYKYKRETVRRQEDRRKLDAHECRDCEAYFQVIDLTEEEKRERLKACSRHRDEHKAPRTPDHYWSIRFPTTQECKDRGVLENTQNKPLQSRRRRRHQLD